jgi:hypothetical protein
MTFGHEQLDVYRAAIEWAMNLPSIFAHRQRTHVCGTQSCPFDADSDPDKP